MALLGKIRRMYYRDKLSLSEIARRTSLSRNTVKKWLKSPEGTEPKYRRRPQERKLAPYQDWLRKALETDAHRPKRDRRTALKLWQELGTHGFTGSYCRVTEFVRRWREHAGEKTGKSAYIPLKFALGEAFQFDWSEDWAVIAGVRTKLQVAHFKLSHNCVRCSCENSVIRKSILLANSVLLFLPRPAAAGAVAMDLLRLESICGQQITQHAVVDGINAKQRVEGLQALRLNRFHQAHFPCFADHHLLKRGGMDQLFAQCI